MGDLEVICLSSDEDEVICPPVKKSVTTLEREVLHNNLKIEKKVEISDSNDLESEVCNKRNSSSENNKLLECELTPDSISVEINNRTSSSKDKTNENIDKKRKLSDIEETKIATKKSRPSSTCVDRESEDNNTPELPVLNTSLLQTKKDTDTPIAKPQLIMKEKRNVTPVNQDIFPMFISLCLQRERSADMEVIVNKLKRNYEQMDSDYAASEEFRKLLNEKREVITNGKGIYRHISELNLYMKNKRKGKVYLKREQANDKHNQPCRQSLPCTSNNVVENVESNIDNDHEEGEDPEERKRINYKIRKIVKVMHKCENVIKKLEQEEVDFQEENDSSYIKLERYKERMVALYNTYCKLTGENADAGRPYLRPKHFSSTQIVVVDQAISKFVNSEIMKKNKIKSTGTLTDALIFPDYMDILQCISNCNDAHNLGLSKRKQGQIAKKAFLELGEHLQRVRQQDYWDTFSLFLEKKEEDPAIKNPELAEKLKKNRQEGEKKMKELFEEYVKKQENFLETEPVEEENDNDDEDEEKDSPEEVLEVIDEVCEDKEKDSPVEVLEVIEDIDENESDLKIDKNSEKAKSERRESKDEANPEKSSPTKENVSKSRVINIDNEVTKVVDIKDVEVTENKLSDTTKSSIAVTEDKDSEDIIDITEPEKSDSSKELKNNNLDLKKPVIETKVQLSDDVGESKKCHQPLIKVRSFATSPSTWAEETDKSMVLQELSLAESYGEGHKSADNIIIQTNYKRGTENSVQNTCTIKVLPSSSSGKKKTDNTPTPKIIRKHLIHVKSICTINDKKAYITELNRNHQKIADTHKGANNVFVKANVAPKMSTPKMCPISNDVDVPMNSHPAHPLPK